MTNNALSCIHGCAGTMRAPSQNSIPVVSIRVDRWPHQALPREKEKMARTKTSWWNPGFSWRVLASWLSHSPTPPSLTPMREYGAHRTPPPFRAHHLAWSTRGSPYAVSANGHDLYISLWLTLSACQNILRIDESSNQLSLSPVLILASRPSGSSV